MNDTTQVPTQSDEDPGISLEQVSADRISNHVRDLKTGALANLTEMRNAIDDLMRAIDAEAADIVARVATLTKHVSEGVRMKGVVLPHIEELSTAVNSTLVQPIRPTIAGG